MSEKSEAAKREEAILAFWKENGIFEESLERGSDDNVFVFYEGPPTANGRPGVHHLEARAFKDAIPRYKTMRGHKVPRRAGWDTHGLPVELEVEKQLGFNGKPDIEKYGVAQFNKKCRESVFGYIDEWQKFSDRMGYWVDQEKAYFTFDASYMESLFNIVKKVHDDGRLYKDYKVLPWCSRCGTALSSHELAQGYQDVKDLALTAKFELQDEPRTYLLAWTTTPWTLPGNVALAVGEDISYSIISYEGSKYVIASARAEKVFEGKEYQVVEEVKGGKLLGKAYKPLYPFAKELAPESEKEKFDNAFKVYAADFVNTEDGTGIVHTAVMYGQDDFELGQKVGLPKVHLVNAEGKFVKGTGFLEGRFVREEDEKGKPTLAVDIVDDLTSRGLFFSKENYAHSYPFCWRCKTPLIYYARDSWFIRMHNLRESLLAANSGVNWEPQHIRDGRMGEWLTNVKDWAISRERYWGTPLPVWESADGSERVVIGSVEELRSRVKRSGNRYFLMRHGESEGNAQGYYDSDGDETNGLTERGRAQVEEAASELIGKGIDKIYVSPLLRTMQTAEILAEKLGIAKENVIEDERLHELNFGEFSGKGKENVLEKFREWKKANGYKSPAPGGESYFEAKNRLGSFLYELEREHANETFLIVSHGVAFESAEVLLRGSEAKVAIGILNSVLGTAGNAEVRELDFAPLPLNEDYELDLHRPYIDDVVLMGDSGNELRRVKEVMDVWFDSGAMPFAQDHYPFENKEWVEGKGFPADFISEAIDQTRGWFYTLLAVGTLMERGAAYKNVICLGHLLDEKGAKMSKSKGNVIEPMEAMNTYGADTLRLWMYSVNQPGDNKSFDPASVKEAARVLSWLENSVKFYQLFADGTTDETNADEEVIDTWMRTRLSQTIAETTAAFDAYDLFTASRSVSKLIEDLSQWYVRRIRERAREGNSAALAALRDSIQTIAVLYAPLAPFIAEWAYQTVRTEDDPQSVHLSDWYEPGTVDEELLSNMARTREVVSQALMLRQKAGIKVSQPLVLLTITEDLPDAFLELIKEEVNVKDVVIGSEMKLDTAVTPELLKEGDERLFARAVAEARKSKGFSLSDEVRVEEREDGEHSVELSTGTKRFTLVAVTNAA